MKNSKVKISIRAAFLIMLSSSFSAHAQMSDAEAARQLAQRDYDTQQAILKAKADHNAAENLYSAQRSSWVNLLTCVRSGIQSKTADFIPVAGEMLSTGISHRSDPSHLNNLAANCNDFIASHPKNPVVNQEIRDRQIDSMKFSISVANLLHSFMSPATKCHVKRWAVTGELIIGGSVVRSTRTCFSSDGYEWLDTQYSYNFGIGAGVTVLMPHHLSDDSGYDINTSEESNNTAGYMVLGSGGWGNEASSGIALGAGGAIELFSKNGKVHRQMTGTMGDAVLDQIKNLQ